MPTKYLQLEEGLALRYLHTGPTTLPDVVPPWDRGTALVFVPGEWGSALHFRLLLESLGSDHSPMALDFPGHGRSTGLTGPGSLDASAELLLRMMENLRIPPAVLIGHGSGGHTVLRAAAKNPTAVKGVITLGTGWQSEWNSEEFAKLESVVAGRSGQFFDAPLFAKDTAPDVMRAYWGGVVQTDPRVRLEDLLAYRDSDLTGVLPTGGFPIRVLRGSEDRLCSASSAESLAAALGTSVVAIPAAGHVPQLETPNAILACLAEVCR